jgi:hypothetical protein
MQSKIMTKEENQSRSANLVTYLVAADELKESGDFMGSIQAMWAEFHPNTPLPTPVH